MNCLAEHVSNYMTETELLGAGLLTGFFLAQGRASCIFAIFFMERLTPLLSSHPSEPAKIARNEREEGTPRSAA